MYQFYREKSRLGIISNIEQKTRKCIFDNYLMAKDMK